MYLRRCLGRHNQGTSGGFRRSHLLRRPGQTRSSVTAVLLPGFLSNCAGSRGGPPWRRRGVCGRWPCDRRTDDSRAGTARFRRQPGTGTRLRPGAFADGAAVCLQEVAVVPVLGDYTPENTNNWSLGTSSIRPLTVSRRWAAFDEAACARPAAHFAGPGYGTLSCVRRRRPGGRPSLRRPVIPDDPRSSSGSGRLSIWSWCTPHTPSAGIPVVQRAIRRVGGRGCPIGSPRRSRRAHRCLPGPELPR